MSTFGGTEAQDLRLGNLINFVSPYENVLQSHKKTFAVRAIRDKAIKIFRGGGISNWIDMKYIEPIPLSEEILERFGAKKMSEGVFRLKNLVIHFTKPVQGSSYRGNGIIIMYKGDIIRYDGYVHVLQNLHHSFTAEELTEKATAQ